MKTDFKVILFNIVSFLLKYTISYALTIAFAFILLVFTADSQLGTSMITHVVPDHEYYSRFKVYLMTSMYISFAIHMIYFLISIPNALLGKDMDNRIKEEVIKQQKSKEDSN